jgi:hypothetical protein
VLALLYVHLLEHRPERMARTVATTHLLDAIAQKRGQPHRWNCRSFQVGGRSD